MLFQSILFVLSVYSTELVFLSPARPTAAVGHNTSRVTIATTNTGNVAIVTTAARRASAGGASYSFSTSLLPHHNKGRQRGDDVTHCETGRRMRRRRRKDGKGRKGGREERREKRRRLEKGKDIWSRK